MQNKTIEQQKICLRTVFYAILLYIYLLMLCAKLTGIYSQSDTFRTFIISLLSGMAIIELILYVLRRKKIGKILFSGILYSIYIVLMLAINESLEIYNLLTYLFFPTIFFLFYISFFSSGNDRTMNLIILIQIFFLFLFSAMVFFTQLLPNISNRTAINTIYFVVVLLPAVMLIDNKRRIIGVIIIVTAAIISLKLGAIFSIISGLAAYYSTRNKPYRNFIARLVRQTFVLVFVFGIIVFVLYQFGNIQMFNKLNNSLAYGGSGRLDLWRDTLKRMGNSNFIYFVFGNFTKTSITSTYNHSVHNDYLEMIWRIGIIGFSLFFWFIWNLFHRGIIKTGKKNNYQASFALNIFMLLAIMLISQIIYVPSYGGILYSNLGLLTALNATKNNNKRIKNNVVNSII